MPDPDFSGFPLRPKGHLFEDFADGQVFEHHWGRTLNEGDATLFASVALPSVCSNRPISVSIASTAAL